MAFHEITIFIQFLTASFISGHTVDDFLSHPPPSTSWPTGRLPPALCLLDSLRWCRNSGSKRRGNTLHKNTLKSSCSFASTLSCLSPSPCHVLYFFSCSNFLQVFWYQSLRPHLPNAQFWAVICNDDDVSDKHTDAQTPNCKRVPTQNTTVIFHYSF